MFRNHYDNDITTWSPQGRIHQIEYAMEAVKQGSATVGVKNKTHAVLVALKRAPSELSSYHKKIFRVDDHVGISIAGLMADARSLNRFMRTECLNYRWAFDERLPIKRLVDAVSEKLHRCTQFWGRRPFGVGLLVAGHDEKGPHIYNIEPSANAFDCKSMAIGARSQSAKTYLERNMDAISSSADTAELVKHALRALRECLPSDSELTAKNTTVSIVGEGQDIEIHEEDVQQFLGSLDDEEEEEDGASMD